LASVRLKRGIYWNTLETFKRYARHR